MPHNDFLQAPWEIRQGVSVVKGSDPAVEFDVADPFNPKSKYAALFDARSDFDCLRVSFLEAVVGENMERLADTLADVLDNLSAESLAKLAEFVDCFREVVRSVRMTSTPPLNYMERAWSVLVQCICDERQQFCLSCNALLLVCELNRKKHHCIWHAR